MANKTKRKLTRDAKRRPASQRPGRVKNLGAKINDTDWRNTATVTLVEQRTCTACKRTYECPAPTLMMKQQHKRLLNSSRLAPLSARTAHPDPLLPHLIAFISMDIPRCHKCTRERGAQTELFPEARYLGVQGQRPPKPPEPAKPKIEPIPDDFF